MAMSMQEMVQKARVRALAEGLKVYRIAPDAYVVPSHSTIGEAHEVLIVNDEPNCPCPGFVNRMVCKHAEAVKFRYSVDRLEANDS